MLADLASVEGRLYRQQRAAKGDKSLAGEIAALERAAALLGDGVPLYRADLTDDERELLAPAFLLTVKPVLVVVNIGEDQLDQVDEIVGAGGRRRARRSACACSSRPRPRSSTPRVAPSCSRASGSARASCRGSRAPRTTCSVGAPSSPPATPNRAPGRSAPGPRRPSARA